MAQIEVIQRDPETFVVTVTTPTTTVHTVMLKHDYYQKLTGGRVSQKDLIEQSFEFLLERESNTSILSSFDLPVIARYFPDFEATIVGRL